MILVLKIAQIFRIFFSGVDESGKKKPIQALWHLKEEWGKSLGRKECFSAWFSSADETAILNKIQEKFSSDVFPYM